MESRTDLSEIGRRELQVLHSTRPDCRKYILNDIGCTSRPYPPGSDTFETETLFAVQLLQTLCFRFFHQGGPPWLPQTEDRRIITLVSDPS